MNSPVITAYMWQCEACGFEEIYPLDKEPSPAVVARAREKAKALRCELCGSGGELSVFWSNSWTEDQLGRQVEHVRKKQEAMRADRRGASRE